MDYVKNEMGVSMGLTPYMHCFELTEDEVRKLLSKHDLRENDGVQFQPQDELREWLGEHTTGPFLVTTSGLSRSSDDGSGIWVQFTQENDALHFRMRF